MTDPIKIDNSLSIEEVSDSRASQLAEALWEQYNIEILELIESSDDIDNIESKYNISQFWRELITKAGEIVDMIDQHHQWSSEANLQNEIERLFAIIEDKDDEIFDTERAEGNELDYWLHTESVIPLLFETTLWDDGVQIFIESLDRLEHLNASEDFLMNIAKLKTCLHGEMFLEQEWRDDYSFLKDVERAMDQEDEEREREWMKERMERERRQMEEYEDELLRDDIPYDPLTLEIDENYYERPDRKPTSLVKTTPG